MNVLKKIRVKPMMRIISNSVTLFNIREIEKRLFRKAFSRWNEGMLRQEVILFRKIFEKDSENLSNKNVNISG